MKLANRLGVLELTGQLKGLVEIDSGLAFIG